MVCFMCVCHFDRANGLMGNRVSNIHSSILSNMGQNNDSNPVLSVKSDQQNMEEKNPRPSNLEEGQQSLPFMHRIFNGYFAEPGTYGECLLHELLPKEIIAECLKYVDHPTLINACPQVCKIWLEIVTDNRFWLLCCSANGIAIPPKELRSQGDFDWKQVCLKNPYGRNLIRNPSGAEEMKGWRVVKKGGDGFRIEQPPVGADTAVVPVCFATSFYFCAKEQIIDLHEEGIPPWVLDRFKPTIRVSEMYAARWDCASTYRMSVRLSSSENSNEENLVSFEEEAVTDQWVGKEWKRVTHDFTDYPPGVRYVLFQSKGRDNQFWKGWYGAKMSEASLTLFFRHTSAENSDMMND